MIPAGMLMLPIWIIAFNLGLVGQWSGLVVAYSVGSIPFSIWILKGYYDTIPKELEEAATIDGASKMQTFFVIMLPLAAPALAIVFLFNFMNAWNDYLLAKIMIESGTSSLGRSVWRGCRDSSTPSGVPLQPPPSWCLSRWWFSSCPAANTWSAV